MSKEKFFKVDFISSLKLRAGWGKTGNSEFPSGSAQFRYSFPNGTPSLNAANFANPDLKWQSDRQYNIGFDLAVLNNRVTLTADYFNKKTTDLLFPSEILNPPPPGSAITWKNLAGNVVNKGFEFAVKRFCTS